MLTGAALLQWLGLGQQVFKAGAALWTDIQAVLAQHGIQADIDLLNALALDADRRKALAQAQLESFKPWWERGK